jgi:hypothetical protein
MKKRQPYSVVILRYRHDISAGELLNIGVLLHAHTSEKIELRIKHKVGRLTHAFPGMDARSFRTAVNSFERGIQSIKAKSGGLFLRNENAATIAEKAMPSSDSSITWSNARFGVSGDLSAAADDLFSKFVTSFDKKSDSKRDDAAVWKPVRDLLAERKIDSFLHQKTIESSLDCVEFDHAWKNGAWHCYQPVSFDLISPENIRQKAARWAGHMLALKDSDEDFVPYFFVGKPENPALSEAYRDAIEILKLSPTRTEVIEESEVTQFVDRIEDSIRHHLDSPQ